MKKVDDKRIKIKHSFYLLVAALIWGAAFVAQSSGGNIVGPYSFNGIRSFIGSIVLFPFAFCLNKCKTKDKRMLLLGGSLCGIILFAATTFQQLGLFYGVSAGKAGFLTACYIVLVPIIGLFRKKKCGKNVAVSVIIAVIGLYYLCIKEDLLFEKRDVLILLCALCFAFHIIVIDYYSPKVNGAQLSCVQFFVCGVLSIVPMYIYDIRYLSNSIYSWFSLFDDINVWIPILYAGVMSCGIAYTLQIIGQKGINPTVASVIMSLESVFSVLAGWIILGEKLLFREKIGCIVVFCAVIIAQLPVKKITVSEEK